MKYLFTLLFVIFIISNSFAQTQKANIHTSRSNIKQPLNTPIDSLPQNKSYDVSHRLTRGTSSSIKRDGENPLDSIQQKANIHTSRSNIKQPLNTPTDSLQQKANINTSRSNTKGN